MTIATLERPSAAETSDLENLTVAAVDESYSSRCPNLAYMTVVCYTPKEDSGRLPKPINAFREPDEHGLIVVAIMLPLGEKHDRTNWWMKGVWMGLTYVNGLLEKNGQKIDVAYVDGGEPGKFRETEYADPSLNIKFESKHGTRRYEDTADPFAVDLLRLADGVVGYVRKRVDKRGNLETITERLAELQKPCITLAPNLPYPNYGR